MKLKQTSETALVFFFVKKQNRQANPLSDKVFMTFGNIPENQPPFL